MIGFVVAGGQSARMGRDKALLPWAASTLLDHALGRLHAVCGEVQILCGPEPRYEDRGVEVVPDAIPEAGAISGVLAGLRHGGGLFLAVDLPNVTLALLRHLVALAHEADAVVPVSPAGPEPLCAVYSAACAGPIEARLLRGERKMTCFWPDVRVRTVEADELARFGDAAALFRNLNTPEDYSG